MTTIITRAYADRAAADAAVAALKKAGYLDERIDVVNAGDGAAAALGAAEALLVSLPHAAALNAM